MVFMPATVSLNAPRIDQMAPQRLDIALFGMGCFLGCEPRLGITRGVWKTVVGYAGGRYESPSYEDVGDHTETVMVEYDPLAISYGQLLELFFLWHSPSKKPASSQHASCIFVKNETERRLAQAAIERYNLHTGIPSRTQVATFRAFYAGENWCQKYFLRTVPWLIQELRNFYRDEESLIQSTLAMRLNGILGYFSPSTSTLSRCLPEDVEFYDLSEETVRALKRIIS